MERDKLRIDFQTSTHLFLFCKFIIIWLCKLDGIIRNATPAVRLAIIDWVLCNLLYGTVGNIF